jgi:hypothetical protein
MKSRVFALLTICGVFYLHAQIIVSGKVLNMDKEPLAYTSIGILSANIGTYSFDDGSFKLVIPNSYELDSIHISRLGYQNKTIAIKALKENSIIHLEEQALELKEVIIGNSAKEQIVSKGIDKKKSSSSITIAKPFYGAEVATLIQLEKGESFRIQEVLLNIVAQNLKDYKIRVKLYSVRLPERTPENLLYVSADDYVFNKEKGTIKFRFKNPLTIKQSIYLSFEWLVNKQDANKIINDNSKINKDILNNYISEKCKVCSKVVYNQKTVVFYNSSQKVIDKVKLLRNHIRLLKSIESKKVILSFQTIKTNNPTYYKYTSFGNWYRYPQSLIASISGVNID